MGAEGIWFLEWGVCGERGGKWKFRFGGGGGMGGIVFGFSSFVDNKPFFEHLVIFFGEFRTSTKMCVEEFGLDHIWNEKETVMFVILLPNWRNR